MANAEQEVKKEDNTTEEDLGLKEYLQFRKMIIPGLINQLFQLMIVISFLLCLFITTNVIHLSLIPFLILFAIMVFASRIVCELGAVIFIINDNLNEIRKTLQAQNSNLERE